MWTNPKLSTFWKRKCGQKKPRVITPKRRAHGQHRKGLGEDCLEALWPSWATRGGRARGGLRFIRSLLIGKVHHGTHGFSGFLAALALFCSLQASTRTKLLNGPPTTVLSNFEQNCAAQCALCAHRTVVGGPLSNFVRALACIEQERASTGARCKES